MQERLPEEHVIWQGSSSQWLNFGVFIFCVVLVALAVPLAMLASQWLGPGPAANGLVIAWLILPLAIGIKKYLDVRCRVYTVTSQRLRLSQGILSKQTEDLEMYRVEDTLLFEPFLLRVVHRGNVVIMSSDQTSPQLVLQAVPKAAELRDQIRKHVEHNRDRKRTRVIE